MGSAAGIENGWSAFADVTKLDVHPTDLNTIIPPLAPLVQFGLEQVV
jgi:hypothetical protein